MMMTATASSSLQRKTQATIPKDWPNARCSSFVQRGRQCWHIQSLGSGPAVILLHGTGASTHSMAPLARILSIEHTCILVDLPGHGFSTASIELTLTSVADGLTDLVSTLTEEQYALVGHSAGAAIVAQMAMNCPERVSSIASINGAFLPFRGLARVFFSPLARGLSRMPGVADLVAWRARSPGAMERLIDSTGSRLTAQQVDYYRWLMRDPGRVRAILSMMAHWDLAGLARRLPCLTTRLLLLAAQGDRTVSPKEAEQVADLAANATVHRLKLLGHLAHEEDPERIAEELRSFWGDST